MKRKHYGAVLTLILVAALVVSYRSIVSSRIPSLQESSSLVSTNLPPQFLGNRIAQIDADRLLTVVATDHAIRVITYSLAERQLIVLSNCSKRLTSLLGSNSVAILAWKPSPSGEELLLNAGTANAEGLAYFCLLSLERDELIAAESHTHLIREPHWYSDGKRWVLQHLIDSRSLVSVGSKTNLLGLGLGELELSLQPFELLIGTDSRDRILLATIARGTQVDDSPLLETTVLTSSMGETGRIRVSVPEGVEVAQLDFEGVSASDDGFVFVVSTRREMKLGWRVDTRSPYVSRSWASRMDTYVFDDLSGTPKAHFRDFRDFTFSIREVGSGGKLLWIDDGDLYSTDWGVQ